MAVNLGTAVGYLDLDTSKFTMGFKQAISAVGKFKDGSSGVSSMLKNVGSVMTSVGKDMTLKVSTPLVAVGAAAVKASSSLEKGLSKVKAISGATSSDMVDLKAKAIEMGAKTKFSASEAADAFTYMAMAGWKTKDMMDGIDGIMNLSAADGLDLATTSDIVTDAITAFGLQAEDSAHFADVLAAASSNANTNVSMLGESFKYVGPVAGSMGYSVEDVSTALGMMANSGIKASQAGTALRTLLTNLAKPTDTMAAAMDALDIKLSDSSGKVKPLSQLMDELRDHFANGTMSSEEFTDQLFKLNTAWADGKIKDDDYNESLQDLMASAYGVEGAERAKYAATLAGKEGMAGLLAILNTSDEDYQKLKVAIDGASEAYDGQGTAAGMAQTMLDNLDGQVTILKSTLESLAISIGDILLPYIKSFVEKLQSLVEWLNGLDDGQKKMLVRIAAIVASIGPLLLIGGKVVKIISSIASIVTFFTTTVVPCVKAIGMLKAGFSGAELVLGGFSKSIVGIASKLTVLTGPVGIVIAIIAGLVAAFVVLWNKSEAFRNFWKSLWENVKKVTSTVVNAIIDFFTKTLPNGLKNAQKKIKEFPKKVVEFFEDLPKNIGRIVGLVLGTIVKWSINLVQKGKEAGKNFLNSVINFFKQLPVKIAIWFAKTMVKVMKFKQEFPAKAKEAAKDFKDKLINGLKALPGKMLEIGKNIVDGVVNGIKNAMSGAKKAISDFASGFVDGFKEALGIHSPSREMRDKVGVQIANGIIVGINSRKGAAKKSASKLSEEIIDAAEKKLDYLETYNKITTAQEIDFWKKIYQATKKGTDANLTAYKNYKNAREQLNQEILSNAEKKLDKLQTYNKISVAGEVAYWSNVMSKLKKGSDEYLTAYKNYVEAKKSYNEQLTELETNYNEKVSTIYSDLKTKVKELTDAYNEQVNSRKEALLSTFKLFDEYEISSDKNGEDLTNNLQSQVDALQKFNDQMSSLEGRGILPDDLIAELREQGVAATGELEALNSLTDEKLQTYVDLWKQRNQLAQDEAVRENKEAYDQLQKDLEKANQKALKKLDTLNTKYQKKLVKLKDQAYSAAKTAGKKTGQGIIDGINSKSSEIETTLDSIVTKINSYMSKIASSLSEARSAASEIDSLSKSADKASSATGGKKSSNGKKSHRQGLTYVPYDGYEAVLHEGERVLTKEEARNRGTGDIFIFNSPKAIDEKEAARQMKKAKQQLALGY